MDLSIPIQFLYNTDTEVDIIQPMKALMSLALPSATGFGLSDIGGVIDVDRSTNTIRM